MRPTKKITGFFKKRSPDNGDSHDNGGKRSKKELSFELKTLDDGSVVIILEKSFWNRWEKGLKSSSSAAVSSSCDTGLVRNTMGLACFDFDSTLVRTRSGKSFAKDANDWKMWAPEGVVEKKLRSLEKPFVIFSNQKGLSRKNKDRKHLEQELLDRVSGFGEAVGVPFLFVGAAQDDLYRKPRVGMWDLVLGMFRERAPSFDIDSEQCFFVGDAAGRPSGWCDGGGTADFSCSDRKFAKNLKIDFLTPDQYFLERKNVPDMISAALPLEYLAQSGDSVSLQPDLFEAIGKPEIVLFCGRPASGKTSFYKNNFKQRGYVHVNKDTLKTSAKCFKAINEALKSGHSVVVDETCPSVESRRQYIEEANRLSVPIRCLYFDASRELCEHLNRFRNAVTETSRKTVPAIAYNMFEKKFVLPSMQKEGFALVSTVPFIASFDSEKHRNLFKLYYI